LEARHRWPQAVDRVVLLGTPSHGAPLEQLAHVAAFTLETIWNPWTWVIGKLINQRAAGIKDLRHGFCLEEDWRHKDQDVLRLQAPRSTRSPPRVRWFVAAGTHGAPEHWVSRVLGDGMVRAPSARGLGFGTPAPGVLPPAQVRVFERTGHMALTHDPAVREQVLRWLSDDTRSATCG
jgi:triacylglycerol lipase